jgi:hypothetical protein
MKTSEKFLQKYTDQYASFSFGGETYSEAGIEVENAEIYGRIRELEVLIETLEHLGIDNLDEINELNAIKKEHNL